MDYTTALAKAKQNPKLIFVDLYADWCVPCRIMEANVYSDPTVASVLNSRFYAVKLNAESQDTISRVTGSARRYSAATSTRGN